MMIKQLSSQDVIVPVERANELTRLTVENARLTAESEQLQAFVRTVFNQAPLGVIPLFMERRTRGEEILYELGLEAKALLASLPQPESE